MSRFVRPGDRDNYGASDWWRAISKPVPYRINGSSVHVSVYQLTKIAGIAAALLIVFLFIFSSGSFKKKTVCPKGLVYNSTYPLSPALEQSAEGVKYRIALVADLDTNSKDKDDNNVWLSYLKEGVLFISSNNEASVNFDQEAKVLKSSMSEGGRGMELSELIAFNGKLYTCDDRTGIVYEVKNGKTIVPWAILPDGDGTVGKAFKCEWAAVKDERLWIGGLGKEWTTGQGVIAHYNPQWVKSVGITGDVQHHNWMERYEKLRQHGGYERPGYMIHESAMWSDVHQQWFFLPRRASKDAYTEQEDEHRATNLVFRVSEDFSQISATRIGPLHFTRGFSSFKFVPQTNDDVIVALKSEEVGGKIASYLMVFRLNGDILLDETLIGEHKYEGIEFI